MKKTYRKVIGRTMRQSLSRLAAIAAIVALGVGLLSGLLAMPINMRAALDSYADRLYLHDLRIVSTLGFTDDDAALIRAVEGVEDVMPAFFTDVFIDAGDAANVVTRVHSLPTDQIEETEPAGYLNRVEVRAGRLPLRRGECVLVECDLTREGGPLWVGGTVTLAGTNGDVSDTLADDAYKIVGIVTTPYYCSVERENASIGNGIVALKMYVPEECFSQEAYSEIFVTLAGARDMASYEDDYFALAEEAGRRIEEAGAARRTARYREVKQESEEALEKARAELADAKREANEQLTDAAGRLEEGRAEIDRGGRELDSAKAQLEKGEKELSEQIETLPGTLTQKQQELADGKAALMDAEAQLEAGERELQSGREELALRRMELSAARTQLSTARTQLETSRQTIETTRGLLDSLEPMLDEAEAQRDKLGEQLPALRQAAEEAQKNYDAAAEAAGLPEKRAALESANAALASADAACADADAAVNGAVDAYMAAAGYAKNEDGTGYTRTAEDGSQETRTAEEAALLWSLATADDAGAEALRQNAAQADSARTAARAAQTQAQAELSAAEASVAAYQAALDTARQRLDAAQAAYDAAETAVDTLRAQIGETRARLAEGERQLADAEAQIAENEQKIADGEKQIEAGEAALDEAEKTLLEGRKRLSEAEKELAVGELQLSLAPDLARLQIELAEKQLAAAREQYEAGLSEWTSGKEELEQGERTYEEQRGDAQRQLADAEDQIAEAERRISELTEPTWYIFDRDDHVSASTFLSNVDNLEAITTVFPVFFFLVAALVALTTMTRMVEEERLQIGTLKALGYRRGQIMAKYLLYAWIATVIGGAAGLAFGFTVIPLVIWNAYSTMYAIPDFRCLFHPLISAAGVGAALLCTTLATLNACWQTLREWAAQLLLPKAPKAGKRILLEHITSVWSRMKFTHKVTARNLFRYKKRFFMTVTGVAGCTALLVTGFGLKDSIGDIVAKQFGEIFTYDFLATLSSDEALADARFTAVMDDAARVRGWLPARQERTTPEANGEKCPAYLFIPGDAARLPSFIDLHERETGRGLALTDDGVVVTEKFAEQLGLSAGGSVTVENADGRRAAFTITGVAENYVESYIYITPELYESAYKAPPTPNSVLGILADGVPSEDEAFGAALLDVEDVAGLNWMSATQRGLDDTIASINYVVYVVILCAGMLAFVVLYNLLNINITERAKEIATIKVLGFFEREVNAYVSRESNVLTVIGMCAGLVLGVFLHAFIMRTVEIDLVMFGRDIKPLSFVFSAALTILFSVLVDLALRPKLRNISMVESMKAPE